MPAAQLENENGEADRPEENEAQDHRHQFEGMKAAERPIPGG